MAERHSLYQAPGRGSGRGQKITEDTPLTILEQKFINNYIRCCNGVQAIKDTGVQLKDYEAYRRKAEEILRQPNVKAEVNRVMEQLKEETIATADEVMSYFTSVMRGEIKDQFGLEAPLSERTKAAQEIAKRTVDIDNRKAALGDTSINVTLSWDD